jgi:flagellar basal-body rod modification protein FlgD
MTGANPIVTTPPPATSTSGSSQSDSLNDLGPNAFITLLTAQLQAQDPLNPMDPDQMVDELTSMNTLQQTIQIRQDLDSLVADAQGTSSPSAGSGTSANAVAALNSPTATQASSAFSTQSLAAAAMSSGLAGR